MSPNLPLRPGIPFGTPFRVGDGDPPFLPLSPHGDVGSTFGFLWDHIWDPWCPPCPSCSPWRCRVNLWFPLGPHLGSLVLQRVPVAPHGDIGSTFGVLWDPWCSSVPQCLPMVMYSQLLGSFGTTFGILGVPPYPNCSPWRYRVSFWDRIWDPWSCSISQLLPIEM